jgi:hypothetical protein
VSDLFCRHNRFTADCPICSKGTLLESDAARPRPRAPGPGPRRSGAKPAAPRGAQFRGPYATAGPYDREGERVEVRLEKVPGGVRLAEWAGGALRRQAPVLPAADLLALVAQTRERDLLSERDLDKLEAAVAAERSGEPGEWGASAGRTGDLQEELRVEAIGEGAVRVARWILRPGAGWELQDAPPMLPAARFADALAAARRLGAA